MVQGRVRKVVFLDPSTLEGLDELAKAYRCSPSDVVRAAVLAHRDGGLRDYVLALRRLDGADTLEAAEEPPVQPS
jgi:hypothetical protein